VDHMSYSALTCYNACARSYRYRYVDMVQTPVSSNLVFGSAFHDAVETLLLLVANAEEFDPLECWQVSWQKQLERNANITYVDTTPAELQTQGTNMLTMPIEVTGGKPAKFGNMTAFLKTLELATDPDTDRLRVEERVTLTLPNVPVPIIGYVDLVTSDGVPCDIKTAARSWAPDKADNELQPTFYLAALNQQGHQVDRFRYYVFTKTKTPKVQVIETRRTASDMFWLIEALGETYRAIEAGIFPPTGAGSWKCCPDYCEYFGLCKK
jgi:hypothetical protein